VEYHPLGVIGAIVPWNYPFHNIFNPMLAAIFSGNAIVIKVSEHATWSGCFYLRIIHSALIAAGASPDLVHIVTGFAETGEALVASVDKVIFVGSTGVGRKVQYLDVILDNFTVECSFGPYP
jgi:acyl-CoA reductase-like NAD-dependent aldehyde dehydrogenase